LEIWDGQSGIEADFSRSTFILPGYLLFHNVSYSSSAAGMDPFEAALPSDCLIPLPHLTRKTGHKTKLEQ
jgi:hypothetical protein